jgi:hypothetical protein
MADRVQRTGSAWLIVASAFLVLALTIGYYVVVVYPAEVRTRLVAVLQMEEMRQVREREEAREREYTSCLTTAYAAYDASWERTCQQEGKGKECSLPAGRAEALNQRYTQAQELCVKKYK